MKLVIDRNIWLRGEGYRNSYLLRRTDQKMCCVGILCEALGVIKADLEGQKTPRGLLNKALPSWLVTAPGQEASDLFLAFDANDLLDIPQSEREHRITTIFAKHDIEVQFIN